jgi:hypothetical protein
VIVIVFMGMLVPMAMRGTRVIGRDDRDDR